MLPTTALQSLKGMISMMPRETILITVNRKRPSHVSDNKAAVAKGHDKHDAPGDDLNQGQSQKALQASDNSAVANGHAKHDAPGDDLNHGQAHRDLQASEEASASSKQHANMVYKQTI